MCQTVNTLPEAEKPEPAVKAVIDSSFALIPQGTSPAAFNAAYLKKHANSAAHVLAGLKGRFALDPKKSGIANEIEALRLLSKDGVVFTLEDARGLRDELRVWGSEEDVLKRFEEEAGKKWPEAVF